jgi:euchromatic histone-lysine N-methyltransferase
MGVMENMLHSESLRTVTSVNGSHSEGRLGKLAMENPDCSFQTSPPKYKRRKVSAVRDFPPIPPQIQSTEMLEGKNVLTSTEEKVAVSSDQVNGLESVNAEPVKMQSPALEALNNAGLSEPVKSLEGKVSAVHDFSPGCGPFAPRIQSTEMLEQKNVLTSMDEKVVISSDQVNGLEYMNAEPVNMQSPALEALNNAELSELVKGLECKVSAVPDSPPGCGRFAPRIQSTEMLEQKNVLTSKEEKVVVSSDEVNGLESAEPVKMQSPALEALNNARLSEPVKDLECKVSAVPDSPLGSEQFPPRIQSTEMLEQKNVLTSKEEKVVMPSDEVNGLESVNAEPVKMQSPALEALNNAGLSEPVKGLECKVSAVPVSPSGCERFSPRIQSTEMLEQNNVLTSKEEKVVFSSDEVNGLESVNAEPATMQSPALEALNNAGLSDPVKVLEDAAFDSSKDLHVVSASASKEEMFLPSGSKCWSPSGGPGAVPNGNGLRKTMAKKYPPRRKVSAIRDFPPLCGRNTPHLSKVESVKVLASPKNKSLGQEKSDVGGRPLEETEKTDLKRMGEDVQNTDAPKSKFQRNVSVIIGDRVGAESDGRAKKKIRKQDGYERSSEMKVDQEPVLDRVVVLGLMAAPNCPWRHGKGAYKAHPTGIASEGKGKKYSFLQVGKHKSAARTKGEAKVSGVKSEKKNSSISRNTASQGMGQIVVRDQEDSFKNDDEDLDFHMALGPCSFGVNLPPIGMSISGQSHNSDAITRNKVRETLRLFQAVCRKLLQEEEAKSKERGKTNRRVDQKASKILKDKGKHVNTGEKILGSVPGVEVGDEFHYRIELNIIGLHRPSQGGIDFMKHGGEILAISIVSSGGYYDDLDNSDSLTYTGQGGNVMNTDKEPEDQKLERGNLALKNSMHKRNPVRVIRGSESSNGKTYIYDGLYLVEKYWQELGSHGKLVYKFQLDRIPGQPELAWKEVKKSKNFKIREGLCVDDISQGKESTPMCVVNTIDDEKPAPFKYVTSMIYPHWCHPLPPKGCDCINGCSDSEKCSCAVKNGGEIPFNYNGAIVEAKPLVYECGPCCKCPSSCHNRVSQRGIKFQLEIFKTKSRGWGVRSLNSIPSGSFICEYIGDLLEDKEAEQRTGNDEYLFDIGNNYNDSSLWDGLSSLMPDVQATSCEVVEDVGFTIDAAEYGNVGRFINHSCSPNLYAQNVLYDHEDKRIPHIMLFAAENIPPLQELTYHYNYMIDQVRDSNGNIKKKSCFCGSIECTGRLY